MYIRKLHYFLAYGHTITEAEKRPSHRLQGMKQIYNRSSGEQEEQWMEAGKAGE